MSQNEITRRDLFRKGATVTGAAALGGGMTLAQNATAQSPDVPLAAKVPTRKLGKTGEDIPILLMGGMQKFDSSYDKMLHRAHKIGMTYIDGGHKYGSAKEIGHFASQVGRENVWITSKSGLWGGNDPDPASRYEEDFHKELAGLQTDYMDMFFMHGIKHTEVLGPDYLAMADKLKKEGKIKYFGFSCHDGNVVDLLNKAASIGSDGINAIMFRYDFTMYGDKDLNMAMDACVNAGIGLMGMKSQTSVPEDSEAVSTFQSQSFNMAQAKLKAVWADERITACVSGINNMQILKDNTTAARSMTDLTAKEMNQLFRYAADTAHHRCKGCSHICESRVSGDLRISDQLRYLMYDECYGDHEGAKALYAELTPTQRDFRSVDLGEATKACPQGIDILKRLGYAETRLA